MTNFIFGDITGDGHHFGDNYNPKPSTKPEQNLLINIYDAIVTLQGRKHIQGSEDQKNDQLRDLLLQKNYSVGDQSRQGRSGSNNNTNYRSGELDIVIRQNNRGGTIRSIIEAFELRSCGDKNTIIKSHIQKLLHCYDTAGNKENYVVVYARAKRFIDLWEKYLDHLDKIVFKNCSKTEPLSGDKFTKTKVKVALNQLNRGDKPSKLYHIFADFST